MGSFVALEAAEESFKGKLLEAAGAAGVPYAAVSLATLRRLPEEADAVKFVLSTVVNCLGKEHAGKRHVLALLDGFDVWANIKPIRDPLDPEEQGDGRAYAEETQPSTGPRGTAQSAAAPLASRIDNIATERGIDDKVEKTRASWAYKLLYLLRYSLAYRLQQDGIRLVCIAIYANATVTRPFYADIFQTNCQPWELIRDAQQLQLGFTIPPGTLSESPLDARSTTRAKVPAGLSGIGRYLDTLERERGDLPRQRDDRYREVDRSNTSNVTLNLQIPFDVHCKQLVLPRVTLICGEQGAGKTTLLNAIVKAWVQGDTDAVVTAEGVEAERGADVNGAETQNTQGAASAGLEHTCTGTGGPSDSSLGLDSHSEGGKRARSAYKLEYYDFVSQYVGCGERFIRRAFQTAKNSKPALIVIDDVELLFHENRTQQHETRTFATLARTLINEIDALDDGVAFVASCSGNVTPEQMPAPLKNLADATIVLTRHGNAP